MSRRKPHPAVTAAALPPAAPGIRPMSTAHTLQTTARVENGADMLVRTLLHIEVAAITDTDEDRRMWKASVQQRPAALNISGEQLEMPKFAVEMAFSESKQGLTADYIDLVELRTMFESMNALRQRMQAAGFDV